MFLFDISWLIFGILYRFAQFFMTFFKHFEYISCIFDYLSQLHYYFSYFFVFSSILSIKIPLGRMPGNFNNIFILFTSLDILFSTPGYCNFIANSLIIISVLSLLVKFLDELVQSKPKRKVSSRRTSIQSSIQSLNSFPSKILPQIQALYEHFTLPFQRLFEWAQGSSCLIECSSIEPISKERLSSYKVIQLLSQPLFSKFLTVFHYLNSQIPLLRPTFLGQIFPISCTKKICQIFPIQSYSLYSILLSVLLVPYKYLSFIL